MVYSFRVRVYSSIGLRHTLTIVSGQESLNPLEELLPRRGFGGLGGGGAGGGVLGFRV